MHLEGLEHARTPRSTVSRRPVHVRRRVAAGGAIVAAATLPAGDHASRSLAPSSAEAAPLVWLSARLKAAPAPTGDATLVLRKHDLPDSWSFTGAD